jgi:hypothetical protein
MANQTSRSWYQKRFNADIRKPVEAVREPYRTKQTGEIMDIFDNILGTAVDLVIDEALFTSQLAVGAFVAEQLVDLFEDDCEEEWD